MTLETTTTPSSYQYLPLTLFLTSFSATLEVFILILLGAILQFTNVINDTTSKHMSTLTFYIFTPCLYAYKAGRMLSLTMLESCYVLLFAAIVYMVVANVWSRLLFSRRIWGSRIEGVKKTVLELAVTFGNPGSVPTVFMRALCLTGNLFPEPQIASDTSVAYITLYGISVQAIIWSYGMNALKRQEDRVSNEAIFEHENTNLMMENEINEDIELNTVSPADEEDVRPTRKKSRVQLFLAKYKLPPISQIVTPPAVGCMFGLLVGIIPPAKSFVFTDPPAIVSAFSHVLSTLGLAMFPISMIVLGSNLASSMVKTADRTRSPSDSYIRRIIRYNDPWALLLALVSRLVVMPFIGLIITLLYLKAGMISTTDPVLFLVLLVQASTPSANNINMLSILNDNNGMEEICEVMLFMYLLTPFTLSLFTTGFLYLTCGNMTSGLACGR